MARALAAKDMVPVVKAQAARAERPAVKKVAAPGWRLDDTLEAVRGGARLVLNYDAASNAFVGAVANTTSSVLSQVRIEVHLSNGTELGPTAPVDLAPGQVMTVKLPATPEAFTGWIAHAEVGGGGAEGSQIGSEGAGEHGSGRATGGEHGAGGERRGGG